MMNNANTPLNKIIRLAAVIDLTGLSESSIWRKEKDGSFPKRKRISKRAIGWALSEIIHWIKSQQRVEA